MSQIGDFAEVELLDAIFNQATYAPASIYMSLHTADPGDTGTTELAGGSYARQNVSASFAPAAAGAVSSDVEISFADLPVGTITHIGIWDAVTAGNFLWGGTLTTSKTTNSGDTLTIAAGDATFTLD